MKTLPKRFLASAFAVTGLMTLGLCQTDQGVTTQSGSDQTSQTATSGATTDDMSNATINPAGVAQGFNDSATSSANDQLNLVTNNAPQIMLNQNPITFGGAEPGFVDGQLMIPVRDVAEQMGATVTWDDQQKTVSISMPNQQSLQLWANPDWYSMLGSGDQGRAESFSDKSSTSSNVGGGGNDEVVLIGNRAYMPFDSLAMVMNGTGTYDQGGDTATITLGQTQSGSTPDNTGVVNSDNEPAAVNGNDQPSSDAGGNNPGDNGAAQPVTAPNAP